MAAIYLPENKLHPFVTQTQNEMHLKGKGSATGTMEIVLGKEKCRDECSIWRSEKPKSWKSKNGQADYLPRHSLDVRTVFEI